MKYLDKLDIDSRAVVLGIEGDGEGKRRLYDIGLTKGAVVECVGESPLGDPRAYLVRGAVIALRRRDARRVIIGRIINERDG